MPDIGSQQNGRVNGEEEEYTDDEIDYSDLYEKYSVEPEEGLDNFVVVDGAPVVPPSKRETLLKVIKRKFSTAGRIKEDGIFMPMDEAIGKSKRFLFIEYETPEQANATVKELDGFALDKSHTLQVNKLTDIYDYGRTGSEGEFVVPPPQAYKEGPHLRSWLADQAGRDQFVTLRGDEVAVWWNRKSEPAEADISRPGWTETYVQWSPLGSYLVSLHRQGVQIWGGPQWISLNRFPHPAVKLIDFSPNERYLVTWSNEPLVLPPERHRENHIFTVEDQGKQLFVWDIRTGTVLRSFTTATGDDPHGKQKMIWPLFKWSPDDKYVGRVIPGQSINIYQTPDMGLLDKKSTKIEGVVDFEWSPAVPGKSAQQLLSFWSPEQPNQTARVGLMTIPSKEVIRTRNLFSVSDCRLHWQSRGDFLCVKADRHTKTKKSTYTNLEFFRINEKNIPVEVVELKDTVINFAWEPKGERFVIISSSDPTMAIPGGIPPRTNVTFYGIEKAKGATGNFRIIRTVEKKLCNGIFWSPKGRHVVVATVGGSNSFELEFWDLDFEGERKENEKELNSNLQLMATSEHYGMTEVEWDPSGRYVATSASIWRQTSETGYRIWDFKGSLLREEHLDRLKQFLWRPRPATLLSKDDQKRVRKNLREYSKVFDEEDAAEQSMADKDLVEARQRQLREWRAWRERTREQVRAERAELGIPDPIQKRHDEVAGGEEVIEEAVEEILEEKEEIV